MGGYISGKVSADGTALFAKQRLSLGRAAFKRTDNGSEVMSVDGSSAGTPSVLWDGDTTAWTRGGEGTVTTEAAYSGTYGLDSGVVGANKQSTFDNGSEIDVAGSYDTLSFWVQAKQYPGNAVLQVQWKNGSGTAVGVTLNVENYVTNMDLDVWQHVSIPVADFNLTANVQRLWVVYKVGTQRHWLDDIQLTASGGGGPYAYRVSSPTGYIYHTERLVLVVSAPDVGWSSSSFGHITGGLMNGLLLKYHKIGASPETYWTLNVKSNIELFGHFNAENVVSFDNSEQLVAFVLKPDLSSVILVDDDEVLEFVVRDNLSTLSSLRAFFHYGTELSE